MSAPSKAVFLSYASQDTAAAQRLCEALRAVGVEVWFDQSELVGGDSWDQKIRGQIKACALFLPMISAATQARGEGYFRLEWKLAAQRTHTIADGIPFLLPIVIDATRDAEALVPEEFRSVQWTRLAGGEASAAFVARVKKLLGVVVAPVSDRRLESGDAAEVRSDASPRPALPRKRSPFALSAAAFAIVVAIGTALFVSKKSERPAAAPAVSPVDAKSIAVLPFANMSDDKDSAFFTDGIHEDILTNLSNIRELKVVSRTTMMQFRDTKKSLRQIGEELGVAYILEGSVRRAGKTVRMTGQLINARTDEHVWAKAYDRDLNDIFAIQSELAQAIAAALQAALSPQEKTLIAQRPTDNLAAYELVLKAREVIHRPAATSAGMQEHQRLLQRALQLDPNYAIAYADLTYSYVYSNSWSSAGSSNLKMAKEAIDAATRLAPGSPDVIRALGDYYYYGHRDFAAALEQYEKFAQLRPNDAIYYNRVASIRRRQAHWAESLTGFRKLEEIEPSDLRNRRDIAILLASGRRFDEAIDEMRRLVERAPDDLRASGELAELPYIASGSTREMEDLLARLKPGQGTALRRSWAIHHGDLAEAVRLDGLRPPDNDWALEMAIVLVAQGNTAAARSRLGTLPAELRAESETGLANTFVWAELGVAEALLGHKDEALRCARKALELMPESHDAVVAANNRANLALVYTLIGDKDAAIAEYAALFRIPYGISGSAGRLPDASVHTMRRDPRYAALSGDPRWEVLLNDPKNNAPLF